MKYQAVIGLEIHAQLKTASKIFCGDKVAFGSDANTHVSVVSLAHPGTLPRINKHAVELAVRMGLACGSRIAERSWFDRKNYFYPDLPKGYQITQDSGPICLGGSIRIESEDGVRDIALNRIHLEEDAGKSIHDLGTETMVDLNRAGTALIEIVTEPTLHTSEEVGALLTVVRRIVRYLDICDGNMEEGSLRCDANVSIRPEGEKALGTKVEIKNMNSIKNVQRAIDHEIKRQLTLASQGKQIVSETRMFDVHGGKSVGMRNKEALNDYRYFPDPDLPAIVISEAWLNNIRSAMPELPDHALQRFKEQYGLPAYDAGVLTESRELASFFEQITHITSNYKAVSNWVMGPIKSYLNEKNLSPGQFPVSVEKLGSLIALVDDGKVSYTAAVQTILPALITNPADNVLLVAERLNVIQQRDETSLQPIIDEVIKEFPLKVEEYRHGKKGIISMFMGEVMRRSKGKADPKKTNELIIETLKKNK